MNRRGFLASLLGAAAAPYAEPFKGTAFSFLGGIFRPRTITATMCSDSALQYWSEVDPLLEKIDARLHEDIVRALQVEYGNYMFQHTASVGLTPRYGIAPPGMVDVKA